MNIPIPPDILNYLLVGGISAVVAWISKGKINFPPVGPTPPGPVPPPVPAPGQKIVVSLDAETIAALRAPR